MLQALEQGARMMVRRFFTGVVIAALALGILAVGAPAASANSSYESQFVNLINKERAKRGSCGNAGSTPSMGSLTVRSDLRDVARRHSARMEKKGDIWHNPNLANEVSGWTVLGENVGMGPSVSSLHSAFMASEGHCKNVRLDEYNEIGVGVVIDKHGDGGETIYVTMVFARRGSSSSSTSGASSSSGSSSSSPSTTVTAASSGTTEVTAPAPKPKPVPKPKPRTLDLLVQVVSLDA